MPNCTVCGKKAYSDRCVAHKVRKLIKTNIQPKRKVVVLEMNPCAACQSVWHYTAFCPTRAKKIPRGRKVWSRWTLCKEEWYRLYGQYHLCHYCGVGLKPETITLDHLIPRSRAPELRYDFNNLVPACYTCNGLKGSVDHDSYAHVCH